MTEPQEDEFAILDEEAAAFGLTANTQSVRRETVRDQDGRSVSSLVWGDERPDLVLLHGVGLNAHTWDATVMALARPAVALDLPGHGDSEWRTDVDYRAETNAASIAGPVTSLAAAGATIVGQSLGGLTAIALLAAHPDLASRLVIIDITPGLVVEQGNQVRDFLAGPTDFDSREQIVQRAIDFGFGPDRAAIARGVLHNTRVRDDGRVIFKHHLANLTGEAPVMSTDLSVLWPSVEQLSIPVLLIRATRGFISAELAEDFCRRVPGATTIDIDAGHNIQEEAPVQLAAAITQFIDRTER